MIFKHDSRDLSGPLLEADPTEALKLLLQQDGVSEMVGVQDATGKTVVERAIDERRHGLRDSTNPGGLQQT